MTAEPRQAQSAVRTSSITLSTNSNLRSSHNGKSACQTQYHHFHSFAPAGTSSSTPTIRFPPGFEPQGAVCGRFPGSTVSNEGLQQHVVDFHVYPGVTISLQMGENVQVFKAYFSEAQKMSKNLRILREAYDSRGKELQIPKFLTTFEFCLGC
ncbi:hypothetical protein Phum_PHUM137690 [Pediculus humanus corporis]|uniref:Uncharacterized protein n=1 Tax=Pediculus humanus subsp. corporis TaxID=121224 RepID=E0VER3_PEDHC|nr:uncharacterized protein Phum_PHUM137690 [Pediculus humanus corporis]EEB11869.1 hypothetical protein Phum_PHUM137690 [Pediculus humanus corporis]